MAKQTWDPGTPRSIASEKNGRFIVESFREDGAFYSVDLEENSCTCPNHIYRIAPKREAGETVPDCKHVTCARDQSARIARAICANLSLANLRRQLSRTDLRPEILDEVRFAIWSREIDIQVGLSHPADEAAVNASRTEIRTAA